MASIQGKNRFIVTYRGITAAGGEDVETFLGSFKSVGGLSKEVETTEWKTGNMKSMAKLPGNTKYGNVTLKKGYDSDERAAELWFRSVSSLECPTAAELAAAVTYRNVYIYVVNRACTVFKKIKVVSAWPMKYEAEDLDSMSNDPWIENLELANSGWEFVYEADGSVPGLPSAVTPLWVSMDGAL